MVCGGCCCSSSMVRVGGDWRRPEELSRETTAGFEIFLRLRQEFDDWPPELKNSKRNHELRR
jgi:hypothetical protein